jgi:preprotein translocase subunit SecE
MNARRAVLPPPAPAAGPGRPPLGLLIDRFGTMWIWEYLQNVASEMEKVNWPSRDELISSTLITLVATFIISGFIFLTDRAISNLLEIIYRF